MLRPQVSRFAERLWTAVMMACARASSFLAPDQTPSRCEQRDHPEHGFSSGVDNIVATDRPRQYKP
jgi:hypothetical protein